MGLKGHFLVVFLKSRNKSKTETPTRVSLNIFTMLDVSLLEFFQENKIRFVSV